MARPIRTKAQRELDLVRTANLYLEGKTQQEIALKIGVTREQINYDIRAIRKVWQSEMAAALDARKAEELARIDKVEAEAWSAWHNSKQATKETIRVAKGGPDDTKVVHEAREKSTERDPDFRFMLIVQWCIEARIKLLGLDAMGKPEDTTKIMTFVDLVKRAKRREDELAREQLAVVVVED